MHNCQDIEENRCFGNGGTHLHIHAMGDFQTAVHMLITRWRYG